MTEPRQSPPAREDSRYLLFLAAALVFLLLVVPFFERTAAAMILLHAGLTAVLLTAAAAAAAAHRRSLLAVAIVFVCVAAPLGWATMLVKYPPVFLVSCVLEAVFFVFVAVLIITAVVRRHLASGYAVFGAFSGYLLLGLAWTMLYLGLEAVNPEAFVIPLRQGTTIPTTPLSELVYFSFVTMSTLGYGDILPQSPWARSLAWLESVTGQFYLAVVVAWLVSEVSRHRGLSESETRGE